jgi:hypothetical protein
MTPEQLADECEQFDTSLYRDATHANAAMTALLQDASAEIRRLANENEALRKDAERWDAVRKHWKNAKVTFRKDNTNLMNNITLIVDFDHNTLGNASAIEREFDAAIAAMQKEAP